MSFSPVWVVFIVLGIGLAVWMTAVQWRARGGHHGDLWALTVVTVPAAVIGGRIGHLLASPEMYFGPGGDPLRALAVWDGGLSFWGGLILGGLAAWMLTRFQGIRFRPFLDAAAPGLLLGQVVAAWGNLFDGRVSVPTVLVESVWNLLGCVVLIGLARRLRLGFGQVFALTLCLMGIGRVLLEGMRIGTPAAEQARVLLGLPFNVWTAILTLGLGFVWLIISRLRHRSQEPGVYARKARTLDRRRGKHAADTGPAASSAAGPDGSDPAVTPTAVDGVDEGGLDLSGRHSFGFFGAVTSAISIVPDVRGGGAGRGADSSDAAQR